MTRSKSSAVTLTEAEVKAALGRKRSAAELDPAEERALRMRFGVGLDGDAPLVDKAGGNAEAAARLLEMEADLLAAARRRAVEVRDVEAETEAPERQPADSRIKSKIVRALRKKS